MERPVGVSLLALLSGLLALLGGFAVLSLLLMAAKHGTESGFPLRLIAMGLFAAGFGAMAVGLWCRSAWVRTACYGLFGIIVLASLMSAAGSGILELGAVLVLGLGFLVNAVILVYLKTPLARKTFSLAS